MAWNDIKNKALKSLNHAAQETDRLAKLSKERATYQQGLQHQRELFTTLGQLVYQGLALNETAWPLSSDMQTLIDQLRTSDAQLQASQQRIEQFSTAKPAGPPAAVSAETKFCGHCGETLSIAAKFCPLCGTPQPDTVENSPSHDA